MKIEERTTEIMNSINSASKESYRKQEILPELFSLQQELVALTFNTDHADFGNLKIWDVEAHLDQMNKSCGGIASEELKGFKEGCKILCNLIKAECSGNRGEYKAFCALEKVRSDHSILKNIELTDKDYRTEIDAVVITSKGAFIVEVKNTHKDIFIDDRGNYYRTGEFMRWDSNIKDKLETKHELLRRVFSRAGLKEINISEIVVFTNNQIEVQNRCKTIKPCFLGQLPYIIDEWEQDDCLTTEEMLRVTEIIEEARCEEEYPLELDVKKYKRDFATLMAKLEAASQAEAKPDANTSIDDNDQRSRFVDFMKALFSRRNIEIAGGTAAVAAVVISTAAFLKKGGK